MKLAWLTDVHLNFLDANERKKFYQDIINTRCDAALPSGDIAEASSIKNLLQELSDFIERPMYPDIDFLVLCGHTHDKAKYCPHPNLIVETGHADYHRPEIQKIIFLEQSSPKD